MYTKKELLSEKLDLVFWSFEFELEKLDIFAELELKEIK